MKAENISFNLQILTLIDGRVVLLGIFLRCFWMNASKSVLGLNVAVEKAV